MNVKLNKEKAVRIETGRLFQRPATAKTRLPLQQNLDLKTENK